MKRLQLDRRSFLGALSSLVTPVVLHRGRFFGTDDAASADWIERNVSSQSTLPASGPGKISGECEIPHDCPAWVHGAVFYQIYPQTFFDSNGDGIGDLPGITKKLDYVKSLGVDAIWLNPFFRSPFGDGGYDISDYFAVDPRYGTNDDARTLFREAHKRGLKVLFDFVASYTSIEHPWFKDSARQQKNTHSNWYIWTDNVWVDPPERYRGAFIKGLGSRNGQYMQNFYYSEPALNYGFAAPDPHQHWQLPVDHPDVLAMREEMKRVFRYWMDMGADGFRADMAGALVKASGVEGNQQFYSVHDDETKKFWREIRAILNKEYPEAFIVSEWSDPKSALDGCFHADFFHWFQGYNDLFQKESWRILNGYSEGHSYFDEEGKGDITFFLSKFMEQLQATKGKGYISLPLGNHDNARLGNRRSDDDLEIIYAFGLTMPGVPFIYYGNEIGMRQMPEEWPQVEGAYRPRNGARTPMQWAPGKNLGFSSAPEAKLYLPVDPAGDAPSVAAQETDPTSLLNRTRRLIALRRSEAALAGYAEFVPLYAVQGKYPFVYARAKGSAVVLVVLNPSRSAATAEFSLNANVEKRLLLAGRELDVKRHGDNMTIQTPGTSFAIYKLQ
ncbi:MAG TPA: alpha-amylase family glycosyl hydrolase [Bacteroidota bacterium]|nr:alpha-amylase family glycosyl hydrolase [Bacteroidota bacterium]